MERGIPGVGNGLMMGWIVVGLCFSMAGGSYAQSTSTVKPEFDVASVRQNKSGGKSYSNFSLDNGNVYSGVNKDDVLSPEGGYFSATNMPLMRYIVFACKLNGTEELALRFKFFAGLSSDVPEWVNTEGFDIKARVDGHPTKEQMRLMMQALLAERFKLVVHKETREAPVFALVLAAPGKLGTAIRAHVADDSCVISESDSQAVAKDKFPAVCGVIAHLPPGAPGRVSFGGRDVSLELLASSLPTQTGMAAIPRPVIDATGLGGTFDLRLEWAPDIAQPDGSVVQSEASGPGFAEALKEQLGFKLKPEKGSVQLLMIDHVERPGEN